MDEALTQIENARPRLALIDAVVAGNQLEETLKKMILLSPQTQRLLLVDDAQHVKWMPQHAEAVLIKGVSPTAVTAMVTNLLFTYGE